jgi:environmental stress-induced protein Ves
MTLNDTMQHYTTLYKTIQPYNYKASIWHHTIPYNVIQDYTTIYKAIRHRTNNSNK